MHGGCNMGFRQREAKQRDDFLDAFVLRCRKCR
jgi:hypothetical protein